MKIKKSVIKEAVREVLLETVAKDYDVWGIKEQHAFEKDLIKLMRKHNLRDNRDFREAVMKAMRYVHM